MIPAMLFALVIGGCAGSALTLHYVKRSARQRIEPWSYPPGDDRPVVFEQHACFCGSTVPTPNLDRWLHAGADAEDWVERGAERRALGVEVLMLARDEANAHGLFGYCYEIEDDIAVVMAAR